jgi:hypothetical protein
LDSPSRYSLDLQARRGVLNLDEADSGLDIGRFSNGQELVLDPSVLTKHAIVLGATGSGKTVFCKAIIEEAALKGIPVLAIDPKGDISCLAICSKDFKFRPYSDVEADSLKQPREEYAQELQQLYEQKTKESAISAEKIERYADDVVVKIFTPKSSAGIPVSISPKLEAPPQFQKLLQEQPSIAADFLDLSVNALLDLVRPGRPGDDQQAVSYLSSILEDQWKKGIDLDLKSLIELVLHPPFEKVGDLPLDQIFPRKERVRLAADLNLFNVHPKLRAWMQGEPLDFGEIFRSNGKTPINVVDLRGIQTQEERLFFVEMLLQQLYSWMIKQQGVQNLRYLLYFDEVVGYCPPVAEPPSKKSLLLLIKQARAFGLGIVLATQNPIDIDYKVISNANVRVIGRLAAERDIERVKVGLALPSDSAETIETLEKGQFLLQVFDPRMNGVVLPRWLMTYHRGPLQDEEISALMADLKGTKKPTPRAQDIPRAEREEQAEPTVQEVSVQEQRPRQEPRPAAGAGMNGSVPSPGATVLGLEFALKPEEVPDHVPRQRKLFGQPEVIGDVKPVYRQLLELGISLKAGVITKKYQSRYAVMDAATGRSVKLGKKLLIQPGLEGLLGLDSREVEVLRSLSEDRYSSAVDTGSKIGVSADVARRCLLELEQRRLVKSTQMGRVKAYKRTSALPELDLTDSPLSLTSVDPGRESLSKKAPPESAIREVVKGLRQDYDLTSLRQFYYPLYLVNLALRKRSRVVWLDGISGEEVLV